MNSLLQSEIEEKLGHEKKLKIDFRTCWNSLLEMISVFLAVKDSINSVLSEVKKKSFFFYPQEFKLLETITQVLDPIREGQEKIGSDSATILTAEGGFKYILRK